MHAEALPLHQRALAIRLKVLGEQHPLTATSYNLMACCLVYQGKHAEALPLLWRALGIHLKVQGEQHPDTARSYNNVAVCLDGQGRHGEALPLHQRALDIRVKVLGERHPDTAQSYNGVAYCLDKQGKHAEALPLLQRALAIRLKVLLAQHPHTATCYNAVGYCLSRQGKHGEALPLYQRALAIRLKVLGEQHSDTAVSYNNLAVCLDKQGKHGEALPLHQRALAIRLKVLGERHPDTATCYNNMACCLDGQGKRAEALPLYQRALGIHLKVQGEQHPDTASCYNNVALCLDRQGRRAEALLLHQRALAIRLKVQGEQHPATAGSYNNMACCLLSQGKHAEALPLLQRALGIFPKVQGEQHPDTATCYNNVAFCLDRQGRRAEALRLLQARQPDQEATRFHVASTGFDRALASTGKASPHAMLAAGLARLGQPRNAFRHAEMALARGLLDDLAAADPTERQRVAALSTELHGLGRRLVPLLGLSALSSEQAAQRDRLVQSRRSLEAALAQLASAVSARQVLALEDIQRKISADAALVLWIDELDEHLGCVLRRAGAPAWVLLRGSGNGGAWMAEDLSLPRRCYGKLTDPGSSAALRAALYDQRLAPLEKHLEGATHLLVVPTGALVKVPVEALTQRWTISYVPSGSAFARAASLSPRPPPTKALVLVDPVFTAAPPKEPAAPPSGLLVKAVVSGGLAARAGIHAGDVLLRYAGKALKTPEDLKDADGDGRMAIQLWREGQTLQGRIPAGKLGIVVDKRPIAEALAAWRAEQRKLLAVARGPEWTPLPGTRLEARALAALLPESRLLLGSSASELRLERMAASGALKGYGLLHLATHGQANASVPTQTALILAQDALPTEKEQAERVLAGKKRLEGRLTVETVLRDWRLDADLVTLSACQTGLGAETSGEGMLGFAQALLQKGARSVLLSRWKVDDGATALLMARFYENLLGKRAGLKAPLARAEALHEARSWLRELSREEAQRRLASLVDGVPRGERGSLRPALPPRKSEAVKDERPFAHPYYWAAFVLVGDPR
jgi:CHAT domain-containing protein/Tfp pilus assembly protein PilF